MVAGFIWMQVARIHHDGHELVCEACAVRCLTVIVQQFMTCTRLLPTRGHLLFKLAHVTHMQNHGASTEMKCPLYAMDMSHVDLCLSCKVWSERSSLWITR